MNNQKGSRKISDFLSQNSIPADAELTYISNKTNYRISLTDFLASIGVTGSIETTGDPLATPVLNKAGSVNQIRNLEDGFGVKSLLSPQDGITLNHNFVAGVGGIPVLSNPNTTQPTIRSILAGSGIAVAANNGSVVVSASAAPLFSKVVPVNSASDFPPAVSGVRTLAPDTVYLIGDFIDLGADRLVATGDTVIKGSSFLLNGLTSTTSSPLIECTTGANLIVEDLTIGCPNATVFNYSSPTAKTGVFVARQLWIKDCDSVAVISNALLSSISGILIDKTTTNGIYFSGDNGLSAVRDLIVSDFTGTLIDLNSSLFNVFQFADANVQSLTGTNTIINGSVGSANIAAGGQGHVSGIDVFGTYSTVTNILPSDIRWQFADSNVTQDSRNIGYISMVSNATVTPIATQNVPVLVVGVWNEEVVSRFTTATNGRQTYIGQRDITVEISLSCTAIKSGGGTDNFILRVMKNGVTTNAIAEFSTDNARNPNLAITGAVSLVQNDYLELWVESTDSTNDVTITAANFTVTG